MRERRGAARDEIRQRLNLVDLVSQHVALKKSGRQYKGLCPFHSEKTPSFHVDPEKGLYYCFGCGRGGDAFDFVMRTGNLTFPEALEQLAARTGVRLERTPEEAEERSEREQMLRALDAAAAFFREQLAGAAGEAARSYLRRRGVDAATARRFGLGYAPPGWETLLRHLKGRGYSVPLLERVGLVQARPGGEGHFDLFRHRLIFPIQDLQDRTVGFGGRALDDATPKYLNSKESPAFSKGRLLYALNWAREAIREAGEVVVVEGYMDALTAHQFSFRQTVATLGTALTTDHVLLLKRFAPRAVVVYDSDTAGMAASERGLELFEEAELPARVAVLPDGRDPDALLRTAGTDEFRTILTQALPMFDYRITQAARRHDPATLEGRVAIVDEVLSVIGSVANPVRQFEYLRALAERFGLAEDALRQRLAARRRPGRGVVEKPGRAPSREATRHGAERFLVHVMVQVPEARAIVGRELAVEEFLDPLHRKLAGLLLGEEIPAEALIERLPDEEGRALLARFIFEPVPVDERHRDRVLVEHIRYLRDLQAGEERRRLQQAIKAAQAAGDEAEVLRLQKEIHARVAQGAWSAPREGE